MESLYKGTEIAKAFLVGEYLTSDLTSFALNKKNEALTLLNLRSIKENPYSNMSNLVISDNLEYLAHDLTEISSDIGFVLDLSWRFAGLNLDKIKRL